MHALICLLMLLLLPGLSQSGADAYFGTWTAAFKGTTFIWLDLRMVDGMLTGRISLGNVHVDEHGHVDYVEAVPAKRNGVDDVTLAGSRLTFIHKDGDDVEHFEMRLVDAASADLSFVPTDSQRQEGAAAGIRLLDEPFRLKRVAR